MHSLRMTENVKAKGENITHKPNATNSIQTHIEDRDINNIKFVEAIGLQFC